MSATVTENEVSAMVANLGLREKPILLRASPVQDHHKFVTVLRPPNNCDPEGKLDKNGREKPGLIAKGFKKAGIVPWDPQAPIVLRMALSQIYSKEG